ncbi:MAG: YdcF family protein [Bacteroidota bacterium]|nr:YdcF family protein [Bacteroidota bacterium]
MLFEGFEVKTGNIISIVFFSAIIILLLLTFPFAKSSGSASLFFLFFVSVSGFVSLVASDFVYQKESKIILVCIFLVTNLFLAASVIGIIFSRSKNFSFMKSLFIFFVILIVSVFIVFIFILNFKDDCEKYSQNNLKANSGVILGAAVWGGNRPSPVLKERINKGYEIYQKNIVPKLVITGGGSPNELTEGEVSKNVLIQYGVAPENLILENSSSSTIEQILFVRDSLYNANNWKEIILISDVFHLPRALEISTFNNIKAGAIASDRELSSFGAITYCLKESLALIIFWMFGI